MCNETRRQIALGEIRDGWSQTRVPLRFPEGLPNLAPVDSVRITDSNAIIRLDAGSGEPELVTRRWSWPGPNGKPVYNFRSEGREFPEGRCLVVADGFYEFTDALPEPGAPKSRRKQKWLFTMKGQDWFAIAGLWRASEAGEAYTLLTVAPGPDVAPYHSRQIVVLGPDDWAPWLNPAIPARDILKPAPGGTLVVERIA